MSVRPNAGAVEEFDLIRFGGPTSVREEEVNIGVTATQLAPNNPDRVELVVTNHSANPLYWSTRSSVGVGVGQLLGSGQTLLLQVQNDGALTAVPLWAAIPAGAASVTVMQVYRQRRSG